ncbi:glycosyltransferase family 25 protein [Mesorhizobium sp. RCC_202]|uniref:glycosyltransferase family 25 protein n=1 Tax=Mesorhizobium sp. RCC_202 TaxID=3239222 RepID=UPI003526871C
MYSINEPAARALLINLDRSSERLRLQVEQFRRVGLEFQRVPAVDGSLLSEEVFRKHAYLWERPLSRSEVGCLLSHQACWQHAIRTGLNTVVFEDDVVLAPEILAFVRQAGKITGSVALNLEARKNPKHLSQKPVVLEGLSGYQVYSMLLGTTGAAAYLITPAAARRLIADVGFRAPIADIYIWNSPGVVQLQLDPGLAAPMDKIRGLFGQSLPRLGETTIVRDMSLTRKVSNPGILVYRLIGQANLAVKKYKLKNKAILRRVSPLPSIRASYEAMVKDALAGQ